MDVIRLPSENASSLKNRLEIAGMEFWLGQGKRVFAGNKGEGATGHPYAPCVVCYGQPGGLAVLLRIYRTSWAVTRATAVERRTLPF